MSFFCWQSTGTQITVNPQFWILPQEDLPNEDDLSHEKDHFPRGLSLWGSSYLFLQSETLDFFFSTPLINSKNRAPTVWYLHSRWDTLFNFATPNMDLLSSIMLHNLTVQQNATRKKRGRCWPLNKKRIFYNSLAKQKKRFLCLRPTGRGMCMFSMRCRLIQFSTCFKIENNWKFIAYKIIQLISWCLATQVERCIAMAA